MAMVCVRNGDPRGNRCPAAGSNVGFATEMGFGSSGGGTKRGVARGAVAGSFGGAFFPAPRRVSTMDLRSRVRALMMQISTSLPSSPMISEEASFSRMPTTSVPSTLISVSPSSKNPLWSEAAPPATTYCTLSSGNSASPSPIPPRSGILRLGLPKISDAVPGCHCQHPAVLSSTQSLSSVYELLMWDRVATVNVLVRCPQHVHQLMAQLRILMPS
mmetsp:Transcript_30941/g.49931  ORF Transcript_30941/g.49931 Transcript_30941/m.49931 type:complete len:216 (-) Transcript_30941:12-659(-)